MNTSLALVIRLVSLLVWEEEEEDDDDLPPSLLLEECFFLCSSAGLNPFYMITDKCVRITRDGYTRNNNSTH